jgi:retron-type reverse transcriptase
VREVARKDRKAKFTALLHHITIPLLFEGFFALKRGAAPGIDGVTWEQYEADLEDRLADLHRRVHARTYRALPSRRVFIPKADESRSRRTTRGILLARETRRAVVTNRVA